jgi:Cu(I)/Ag(I) efflux system membrane fusion protein
MKPLVVLAKVAVLLAVGAVVTLLLVKDGVQPSGAITRGDGASMEVAGLRETAAPAVSTGHADHETATPSAPVDEKPLWHCPMHPSYVSDRPGDCPICNMRLVPIDRGSGAEASGVPGRAVVKVSPQTQALIGVVTGTVERTRVARTVRAAGRVEADERRLFAVSLRAGGFVEELFVNETGQVVETGDPLFTLYSPEVLEAENAYIVARRSLAGLGSGASATARSFAGSNLESTRERLLNLDLTPAQIGELESRDSAPSRVTILAKGPGVVTRRNVVLGSYAEPGRTLLELADLSSVWVLAEVYEYELSGLRIGMRATVTLDALPGETVTGEVAYVYPTLEPETRTVRVRIELPNPDGRLMPGMNAQVSMPVDLGEQLVVDDQAVMDTGTRRIVFVLTDDATFSPREVTLGPRADGLVVVLEGLMEGERIVESGNFLIDSESRLGAALTAPAHGH